MSDENEPLKPRKIFLFLSTLLVGGVIISYIYQDDIIYMGGSESQMAFVTLLIFLIVGAIFFIFCYRNPKLGEKLFFGRLPSESKEEGSYHFSAGFKAETGVAEKRLNTARKSRRATRKQLAEVTRQMQDDKTDD